MVKKILMFQDHNGKAWPTEEEARHVNGLKALEDHLIQEGFTKDVNLLDILKHDMEWTNVYLKGQAE